MLIFPDQSHVDGFVIHLTKQELVNLRSGASW